MCRKPLMMSDGGYYITWLSFNLAEGYEKLKAEYENSQRSDPSSWLLAHYFTVSGN